MTPPQQTDLCQYIQLQAVCFQYHTNISEMSKGIGGVMTPPYAIVR